MTNVFSFKPVTVLGSKLNTLTVNGSKQLFGDRFWVNITVSFVDPSTSGVPGNTGNPSFSQNFEVNVSDLTDSTEQAVVNYIAGKLGVVLV